MSVTPVRLKTLMNCCIIRSLTGNSMARPRRGLLQRPWATRRRYTAVIRTLRFLSNFST